MGTRLPDGEGGEQRAPASPLYCVLCLAEGFPKELALIGEHETVYANEDGEPVCSMHGDENNLLAMNREMP